MAAAVSQMGTTCSVPRHQQLHTQHHQWSAPPGRPAPLARVPSSLSRRQQQQHRQRSRLLHAGPQDRDSFIPPPPMPPPPPPPGGQPQQQQQQPGRAPYQQQPQQPQYSSATPKFQELGWREIKERYVRPTYLPASFALGALTIGLRLGAANYTFAETPFEFLGTAVSTGVMCMALAWVLFDFDDTGPPSPGGGLSTPPPPPPPPRRK